MNQSQQEKKKPTFAALVLAADRTTSDPVTQHTGVACKAFASICGKPMIIRVIDALVASDLVASIVLCGPPRSRLDDCPQLKERIESGEVTWLPNQESPSLSAEHGLNHLPNDMPVLLTTADHALLAPQMVQYFLTESLQAYSDCDSDATVGVVKYEELIAAFPQAKRTAIHLREGGFCGCNLYTFKPQGRKLVKFWRQAEDLRKRPWRLIAHILNFRIMFSYLFKRLSLKQALDAVAEKSGVRVQTVKLPDVRAGVDVDKIEDLRLVESILNKAPVPFYKRRKNNN